MPITPNDVASVNAARAQNVAAGISAYSGAGAKAVPPGVGSAVTLNSTTANPKDMYPTAPRVGGAMMADGSFSQTGLSSTGLNATNPNGQDFTVPKTDVVSSNALIGGKTISDLLATRTNLEKSLIAANTPSQNEQDLTEQLNTTKQLSRQAQLALSRETEKLQTQNGVSQDISNNFVSDTARRYARTISDLGVGASGLADQLNAEINKRTAAVSAVQGQLNADKDTIGILHDLQTLTQPTVIGSPNVNPTTGQVTIFQRDPQTGAVVSSVIGNVGAQKAYVSSGVYTDPTTQSQMFYGVTPDGKIETHNLSAGIGTGQPIGAPGTKPVGKPDYQVAAYANRALNSDSIINKIGDQFANPVNILTNKLPNFLKPAEKQQFEQAQRDFVNAILRRESGAAISTGEFENANQQYFPQPGDSPEVIAQKAVNRATALNGLIGSAGVAYTGTFVDPTARNIVKQPVVSNGVDLSKFWNK